MHSRCRDVSTVREQIRRLEGEGGYLVHEQVGAAVLWCDETCGAQHA